MRTCARCKEVKDVSEFRLKTPAKPGYKRHSFSYCTGCERDYKRGWARSNPEKIAHYMKQDRERHIERYQAQDKRCKAARYEAILDENRKYRARKTAGVVEDISMEMLYQRDSGVCGICSRMVEREKATMDHVIPLSKGGSHLYGNVQTAHKSCNSRKGAKLLVGKVN